eukprot:12240720-Alexandrium_andersonii.AAC.1
MTPHTRHRLPRLHPVNYVHSTHHPKNPPTTHAPTEISDLRTPTSPLADSRPQAHDRPTARRNQFHTRPNDLSSSHAGPLQQKPRVLRCSQPMQPGGGH